MALRDRVDIDLDESAILRLQVQTSSEIAHKGGASIRDRAARFAPKQTGALAASIRVEVISRGIVTIVEIGSDLNYARYQEFGTGPIFPRSAKVLAFRVGGKQVFAMRTSGVPATHFMLKAQLSITESDFK